jgi:hypothetical protein
MAGKRAGRRRKTPLGYGLEFSAPVNGKVGRTTVTVLDAEGKTQAQDKGDLADGGERARVAKRIAGKLGVAQEDFAELFEKQWAETWDKARRYQKDAEAGSPEAAPPAGGEEEAPSAATRLIALALRAGAALSHAPDGQAHLTVTIDGSRETWAIRSRAARSWLRLAYYQAEGRSAGTQAVEDALGVLEGMALCEGTEREAHARLAVAGGRFYLDLADAGRNVVEIGPGGWRVVTGPPVLFRRPRGLLALPLPQPGGDLAELRRLLNVEADHDWRLLLVWALAALRPHGPYPVLCVHGQQGSAKSTLARMLRSLIDPSAACLRCEPRDPRDVMIAATNGWVVALDNLSSIQPWLSDCLCRLATGGGFATRELYSDAEETILDAQRPVILTSIEDLATRGDLLDRAVVLTLPHIPEERRRPEGELWAEFDRLRPLLLGALLDALAAALGRLPEVRLDRLPRMADFALLGAAAEAALGWPSGAFAAAYADNRQAGHGIALEASPVVPPLAALAGEGPWEGTAGDLLAELTRRAGEAVTRRREWPTTARALSGRLRRLAPNLVAVGVTVSFGPGGPRGKARMIQVRGTADGADGADGTPQSCSYGEDVRTPWDEDDRSSRDGGQ